MTRKDVQRHGCAFVEKIPQPIMKKKKKIQNAHNTHAHIALDRLLEQPQKNTIGLLGSQDNPRKCVANCLSFGARKRKSHTHD